MTYSEILVAKFESTGMNETEPTGEGSCTESGTWIIYDSKLSSLGGTESGGFESEECVSRELQQYRPRHPQKSLSMSFSRSGRFDGEGHMDGREQRSCGAACLDN